MNEKHDSELGRELGKMPIFEHGPQYWSAVQAALEQPPLRLPAKRPGRRLLYAAAAAAIALALSLALVLGGLPGVKRTEPQQATAATVLAAIERLAPGLHSVVGEYYSVSPGAGEASVTVSLTEDTSWLELDAGTSRRSSGSASVAPPGSPTPTPSAVSSSPVPVPYVAGSSYSARQQTQRDWQAVGGQADGRVVNTGMPATAGVWPLRPGLLGLRALTRALLAESDVPATSVDFNGRPAWRLRLPAPPYGFTSGATSLVTIDKATGFLLQWVSLKDGKVLVEIDVTTLRVNTLGPDNSRLFDFPSGVPAAPKRQSSLGHRLTSLATAARVSQPLLPGDIPQGFKVRAVSVSRAATVRGTPTLSVLYTRGLDALAVDLFASKAYADRGTPKGGPAGDAVRLGAGFFGGVRAHVMISAQPPYVPHLTIDDKQRHIYLTISGDLTRRELVAAANSLTAWEPGLSLPGVSGE